MDASSRVGIPTCINLSINYLSKHSDFTSGTLEFAPTACGSRAAHFYSSNKATAGRSRCRTRDSSLDLVLTHFSTFNSGFLKVFGDRLDVHVEDTIPDSLFHVVNQRIQ